MLLEDRPEAKELSFTRDGLAIDDAGPWAEAQPRSPVCRGFVRFATRSGVSPSASSSQHSPHACAQARQRARHH
jgi:hypothetical protein